MKPIEAKNQVRLGAGRCLQLALTGMSFRMFRAGITMAILALAVAFLAHMLAYGLIAKETRARAWEELAQGRAMGELITRLGSADQVPIILDELATDHAPRLAEYRRWSGMDEASFAAVVATAVRAARAARYLEGLPPAQQSVLMGERTPRELFDLLQREPEAQALFTRRLETLNIPAPLGSGEAFRRLIHEQRPRVLAAAEAIASGHRRAVRQVRQRYPDRTPRQLAADPPADFARVLGGAGFSFEASDAAALRDFARRADDLRRISELLLDPRARAAVARRTNVAVADVGAASTFAQIDSEEDARWLSGVLAEVGAPARLDGPRIAGVAARYRRHRALQDAAGDSPPTRRGGGMLGLSERSQWLIALSFLVCVVGVANAMLMSVTERFTEIATMKCLGAMDRFVMMMFVFEAVIQGVFGGIAGLALGIVLALLRGLVEFGGLMFAARSAMGEIALAMAVSLAVGIVLAAVAAVGPSWVAARLAPMEAMRVD